MAVREIVNRSRRRMGSRTDREMKEIPRTNRASVRMEVRVSRLRHRMISRVSGAVRGMMVRGICRGMPKHRIPVSRTLVSRLIILQETKMAHNATARTWRRMDRQAEDWAIGSVGRSWPGNSVAAMNIE